LTRARRPAVSPKCCWIVVLPRWLPPMSGTASWHGRCATIAGDRHRADQRPRAHTRGDRRTGRPGGADLSFISLTTCYRRWLDAPRPAPISFHVNRSLRWGRAWSAPAGGPRPRCARIRCSPSAGGPASWVGTRRCRPPARYRGRRAMSNTSCGCAPRPIVRCLRMGWSMPCGLAVEEAAMTTERTVCWWSTPAGRSDRRPRGA